MAYIPIVKTILNCMLKKPATVSFPKKPLEKAPTVRGKVELDESLCIYCGICARKCPTGAIKTDRNAKEWEISPFNCIVCGACTEACPKKCLFMRPELTRASDRMVTERKKAIAADA